MDEMDEFNDFENTAKKWNQNETKLLITERLQLEQEFSSGKRKKSVLWGVVLSKIKAINPNFRFSKEEIIKKFGNLLTTYERIQQRNKKTGRNATLWEYWDEFDEVYKARHSFNPPRNVLISSFEAGVEGQSSSEKDNVQETEAVDNEENQSDNDGVAPKRKRRKDNEILAFIKEEARKDKERLRDLIELEKQSIAVEKDKVEELKELRGVLQSVLGRVSSSTTISNQKSVMETNGNQ